MPDPTGMVGMFGMVIGTCQRILGVLSFCKTSIADLIICFIVDVLPLTVPPATGMPCTTMCSGGATAADLSTIRDTCAEQGREKYMAAGGDAADWAHALESGAETKATDTLSTCFDNLMSTNSMTWESITPALEMTYRKQCEGNAESEFIRNGGDPTMWHEAQTAGVRPHVVCAMLCCLFTLLIVLRCVVRCVCTGHCLLTGGECQCSDHEHLF